MAWCEELKAVEAKNETLLDWFVTKGMPLEDYDSKILAQTTINTAKSGRQWTW